MLDPVNSGGEAGNDNPAFGLLENLGHRRSDDLLAHGVARLENISRVGEQAEHPPGRQFGEFGKISRLAKRRGHINFPIGGVIDQPNWSGNRQT